MATFLELCQKYRSEIGIPGNGPVTVLNQIGELARVVEDIRDADLDIKRQWQDWQFMWGRHSSNTVADSNWLETQKPADLGVWDTDSCYLEKGTDNAIHLEYVDYHNWRNDQAVGVADIGIPTEFTILPDRTIRLYPHPDQIYLFSGEYYRRGVEMTADNDVSDVPLDYHRIIIVRAKLHYAEREDAPEIMAGASAEYDSLMTNMEAAYLEDQGTGKQARAIRPNVVRVE